MSARTWAIVPAAGIGSRMGGHTPKQYLPLGDSNVLQHTLQALHDAQVCDHIVLALHVDDDGEQLGQWRDSDDITCVTGGAERSDSVLAALDALSSRMSSTDWVMVHDAARPCVRCDDIRRLHQHVSKSGRGAILAQPVVDTVKQSHDGDQISATLDRSTLWCAQTPQMFNGALLQSALRDAKAQGVAVTDEASAMEWAGHPVGLIAGASDNLKITHPADLPLAQWYLQQRASGS